MNRQLYCLATVWPGNSGGFFFFHRTVGLVSHPMSARNSWRRFFPFIVHTLNLQAVYSEWHRLSSSDQWRYSVKLSSVSKDTFRQSMERGFSSLLAGLHGRENVIFFFKTNAGRRYHTSVHGKRKWKQMQSKLQTFDWVLRRETGADQRLRCTCPCQLSGWWTVLWLQLLPTCGDRNSGKNMQSVQSPFFLCERLQGGKEKTPLRWHLVNTILLIHLFSSPEQVICVFGHLPCHFIQ